MRAQLRQAYYDGIKFASPHDVWVEPGQQTTLYLPSESRCTAKGGDINVWRKPHDVVNRPFLNSNLCFRFTQFEGAV